MVSRNFGDASLDEKELRVAKNQFGDIVITIVFGLVLMFLGGGIEYAILSHHAFTNTRLPYVSLDKTDSAAHVLVVPEKHSNALRIPAHIPEQAGCSTPAILEMVWFIAHNRDKVTTDGYSIIAADWAVWISNGEESLSISPASAPNAESLKTISPPCRALLWTTSQSWLQYNMDKSFHMDLSDIKSEKTHDDR